MGRPKKETVILTAENGPEIDNTINTDQIVELIMPELVVEVSQKTESIHDKYRKYINQVQSNFLHGLQYGDSIQILRWVEKKTGHSMPLNTNCATCMINLIKLFANLEEK